MNFDKIINLLSIFTALAAVCVSVFAVLQARKSVLTGAYFSEMTKAYSDFLRCVAEFGFRRGEIERDNLASALYRLMLFASPPISEEAQERYRFSLAWAQSNPTGALSLDDKTNQLGRLMKAHLATIQKKGTVQAKSSLGATERMPHQDQGLR